MAPLDVHWLTSSEPVALDELRRRLLPEIRLTVGAEPPAPARFDVLIAGSPKREYLTASSRLRTLIIPWAGLPASTREVLAEFPSLRVHNIHHNAAPAAELAMALLLSTAKLIVPNDQALRRGDWRPRYESHRTTLLAGKRALILGYGAIGQRIARGCRGLGMQVTAIRRRPAASGADGPDEIHGPEDLARLLAAADALLIALPLTPATRGLIDRAALARMRPEAIVVNVARGPIIEEQALYERLRDGRLAAAGLDVWYNYPQGEEARAHTLPAECPFHELDNIVMSPHRGGAFGLPEQEGERMRELARALNAAARGEPIPHPVDVEAGY